MEVPGAGGAKLRRLPLGVGDVRARLGMEAAVFVALALWALVPFAVFFLRLDGGLAVDTGRGVFYGSTGLVWVDQLQYMAWIREAGEHVLFSNRFDVKSDPRLFFHPMVAVSGLAWKLGASMPVAFLLWIPVTVILLFAGFAAYVRRFLAGQRAPQAAALVLALFFVTPASPLVDWLGGEGLLQFGTLLLGLELFSAGYLWGGFGGAISIALMPLFLLGVERILDPSRRRAGRSRNWYVAWTGTAGLFASWLHPWQGVVLLLIVAGFIAWDRFRRRNLVLAVPVGLTVAPLLYLFVLSRTDSSWGLAGGHGAGYSHLGWWFYLSMAPALLALPGFRGGQLDLQERMLRLWPAAALIAYFGLQQSWFYHALAGLTLPLAILGVRGWQRVGLPRGLGAVALVALTLPGMAWTVQALRSQQAEHFLAPGEHDALAYIERSPRPGAVLAPLWVVGPAVPAFAGRSTWIGHPTWTPNWGQRSKQAEQLFAGRLRPAEARRLVREAGVAFVASDCRRRTDLRRALRPLLTGVRRFGCATVYEVRAPT